MLCGTVYLMNKEGVVMWFGCLCPFPHTVRHCFFFFFLVGQACLSYEAALLGKCFLSHSELFLQYNELYCKTRGFSEIPPDLTNVYNKLQPINTALIQSFLVSVFILSWIYEFSVQCCFDLIFILPYFTIFALRFKKNNKLCPMSMGNCKLWTVLYL